MSRPARRPVSSRGRPRKSLNGQGNAIDRPLKIGEAAKLLNVEAYVLRFWETQFPLLRPNHTVSKHRLYGTRDIDLLRLIKRLLYDDGFTIEGAKKRLKESGVVRGQTTPPKADGPPVAHPSPPPPMPHQALIDIRYELESLYQLLKD